MKQLAPGLRGVVLTETRLSMVDGQAGKLVIAGFPLEALAPHACFEEVLYLLWHDRLPDERELEELKMRLAQERTLPEITLEVLRAAAKRGLPPMDALRMATDTLSLTDADPADATAEANLRRAQQLVAAAPTIVAGYWRLLHGLEPVQPEPNLAHAANFLYMLFGKRMPKAAVRGLEVYLNTVVDHGMNNSTFTARTIASTRSDMVSAVVGAIGALKGPLHGGAPGPAMDMVFEIQERAGQSGRPVAEEAERWAREALNRRERLMGFGHRVYRVRDPRADVLAAAAETLFREAGNMALYETAKAVEEVMLRVLKEHRPGRSLKTNVEFYTALVLHGVGLGSPLFSSVFALSRIGGWTAHVLEQLAEDELIRPDSRYRGAEDRRWLPVQERRQAVASDG